MKIQENKYLKSAIAVVFSIMLILAMVPITTFAENHEPVTTPKTSEIPINETTFPDINFRNYVKVNLANNTNILTAGKINNITEINVNNKNIQNLTGIEHFTALEVLYCNSNNLTELDLSQNKALTGLACYDNKLTQLDLSQNTNLIYLYCDKNRLTELDLSQNKVLTHLFCPSNKLTELDLSQNKALTHLFCFSNNLTQLDLSQNKALTELYCKSNKLTELDLSQNKALTELNCDNNKLISLDTSKNTKLRNFSYANQTPVLFAQLINGKYVVDFEKNDPEFDLNKISDVSVVGGTYDDVTKTVSFDSLNAALNGTITYKYNTGNDIVGNTQNLAEMTATVVIKKSPVNSTPASKPGMVTETSHKPATGDSNNTFAMVILIISVVGVSGGIAYRRKSHVK